jgi:hypothetical protein
MCIFHMFLLKFSYPAKFMRTFRNEYMACIYFTQLIIWFLLFHPGWDSSPIWCYISPVCSGTWVFYSKSIYNWSFARYLDPGQYAPNIIISDVSTLSQLRAVRAVAVLGGLLQIILFMFLCGISATVCFICCWCYEYWSRQMCYRMFLYPSTLIRSNFSMKND